MAVHFKHTTERAPFFKGREPVTLTLKELRELNLRVGLAERNMRCMEAVLVKRLGFADAGRALGEKASYVRGAYIWGMKQFGLDGAKGIAGDYVNRLIIEGVPEELHAELTKKVLETVPKLLARNKALRLLEATPEWQSPQPVVTQSVD